MKLNMYTTTAIAWITFMFGLVLSDVGTMSDSCNKPMSWQTPIVFAVLLLFPFILGYLGGQKER